MPEPEAGDRIRFRDDEGVVVFRQANPGVVHIGRAPALAGKRYVVMQPDDVPDEVTIWEDEWPDIQILEHAE